MNKNDLDNKKNIPKELNKLNKYNLKKNKSLEVHDDYINSMSLFPSGNLVSVSSDKSIKIYDKNLNIIQQIKNAHDDWINYVDVKNDNNLVTCSSDKTIKTWIKKEKKFKINKVINNPHNNTIWKVIYFLNDNLISCSSDNTIKIWELNNNKYQNITILTHSDKIFSMLLLGDKNILISSGWNENKFWNLNNFELIIVLEEIECGWLNSLSRIDEDKIIIIDNYPDTSFRVISILEKKIIKEINNQFSCRGISVIKEKGIFLVGGESKDIKIYRLDNYEYILTIYNTYDDFIRGFIQLKNGTIGSYGDDKILNIWSFEFI